MKTETKATKRLADHSTIAIITARGGSKRIPRKNEFYTQLVDIERELIHYKKHFKNKIIFCEND